MIFGLLRAYAPTSWRRFRAQLSAIVVAGMMIFIGAGITTTAARNALAEPSSAMGMRMIQVSHQGMESLSDEELNEVSTLPSVVGVYPLRMVLAEPPNGYAQAIEISTTSPLSVAPETWKHLEDNSQGVIVPTWSEYASRVGEKVTLPIQAAITSGSGTMIPFTVTVIATHDKPAEFAGDPGVFYTSPDYLSEIYTTTQQEAVAQSGLPDDFPLATLQTAEAEVEADSVESVTAVESTLRGKGLKTVSAFSRNSQLTGILRYMQIATYLLGTISGFWLLILGANIAHEWVKSRTSVVGVLRSGGWTTRSVFAWLAGEMAVMGALAAAVTVTASTILFYAANMALSGSTALGVALPQGIWRYPTEWALTIALCIPLALILGAVLSLRKLAITPPDSLVRDLS